MCGGGLLYRVHPAVVLHFANAPANPLISVNTFHPVGDISPGCRIISCQPDPAFGVWLIKKFAASD